MTICLKYIFCITNMFAGLEMQGWEKDMYLGIGNLCQGYKLKYRGRPVRSHKQVNEAR